MVSTEALIHAVLHLEQMLTTGMGLALGGRRSQYSPKRFPGLLGLADSHVTVLPLQVLRASLL